VRLDTLEELAASPLVPAEDCLVTVAPYSRDELKDRRSRTRQLRAAQKDVSDRSRSPSHRRNSLARSSMMLLRHWTLAVAITTVPEATD